MTIYIDPFWLGFVAGWASSVVGIVTMAVWRSKRQKAKSQPQRGGNGRGT